MSRTGERVQACAEETYARLPRKGKPDGAREWTVLAAIVEEDPRTDTFRTLALATGNKCVGGRTAAESLDGGVLLDGHAEVLARRAFRHFLYRSVESAAAGDAGSYLEAVPGARAQYRVRAAGRLLHLYATAVPCGDCALYETGPGAAAPPAKRARAVNVTGARRTGPAGAARVSVWEEGGAPAEGVCRAKPGRGDATVSMSCSDKIAMWNVAGLQGALLSLLVPEPLWLASVVVAAGSCGAPPACVERACVRGLWGRVAAADPPPGHSFAVHVLPGASGAVPPRAAGRAAAGCGVVWNAAGLHEVVLTHAGRLLGATKATRARGGACSAVSKRGLAALYAACRAPAAPTYGGEKAAAAAYRRAKEAARAGPLRGWIPKPPGLDGFSFEPAPGTPP